MHDGLVANPVRCIYQDSKGFIWIGTFEGLSRYDGYKFNNYNTINGLSHDFVNSIIEINGKLLIAENNGAVDIIQNNVFQKGFTAPSAVNFIQQYGDRLLLTTDANGFYDYKNERFAFPRQDKSGTPLGHFLPLMDSFLLTDSGDDQLILYRKDLTVHSIVKNFKSHFYFLFMDSKKRLWAGTSGGLKLLEFSPGRKNLISVAPLPSEFNFSPLTNAQVTSIVEEKDGSFWIGTMKGLVRLFPNGNFHVYNEKEGLPSAIINTIYQDRENNLWIGTALGLAKWVSKNSVLFYNTEQQDFKNDVTSIHYLDYKKVLLSTAHGLQEFFIDKKEFKDLKGTGLQFALPVQGSAPLLVHYADNIGIFDSARKIIIPVQKLDTSIHSLVVSARHKNGTLFLGTFEGLHAVTQDSVAKLLPYRITSLAIDINGTVWAGTWQNGLFQIPGKNIALGKYVVHDITSLLKEKAIRSLFADSKKNVWVGTRYGGAYCLTEQANMKFDVKHFNRQSGLMSDWVSSFAETSKGDMWIGTYLGIDKLVKEPSGYRVFNFSKAVNFFAEIKKIVSAGDNEWVCLANTGVAYFKDEDLHQTPPLPASILSASLGVLNNRLTIVLPNEKLLLKPNQNAARFEFSSLGFVNERQIMYSYRLKGSSDTTWSKPENTHEASYASLSPGNYTFEVKTIGWNGQHSTPASFSFFIATPFWRQWWFISLCMLAVAIFFYGLYRYRIRQLLRLQNVRNSIATDLHDDIGSSLTNISILSELGSKNISHPVKARQFLQRISEEVQTSSQAMDDIIWSVNSHNDSLQETMARMRRYAAELFDNSETNCHLQLDENTGHKKLSMEQRRDVYLIYKEAINNIHKHADAKNVWIEVDQNQNHLCMQIKDDGKGFNTNSITHRNGLKNLRSRAEKWNGKINISSEENKGTTIEINIPLKD